MLQICHCRTRCAFGNVFLLLFTACYAANFSLWDEVCLFKSFSCFLQQISNCRTRCAFAKALSAVYSMSYYKFLRNDRSRPRPGYVVEELEFRITIF